MALYQVQQLVLHGSSAGTSDEQRQVAAIALRGFLAARQVRPLPHCHACGSAARCGGGAPHDPLGASRAECAVGWTLRLACRRTPRRRLLLCTWPSSCHSTCRTSSRSLSSSSRVMTAAAQRVHMHGTRSATTIACSDRASLMPRGAADAFPQGLVAAAATNGGDARGARGVLVATSEDEVCDEYGNGEYVYEEMAEDEVEDEVETAGAGAWQDEVMEQDAWWKHEHDMYWDEE